MIRAGSEKVSNRTLVLPVKAKTVLEEATIAAVDSTGYAVPGAKATGLVAAGCVQRYADNSTGTDGEVRAEVRRGTYVWNNDGTIKETDILKTCYIAGPKEVTITADGASAAGIILAVDDDGVTVDMM